MRTKRTIASLQARIDQLEAQAADAAAGEDAENGNRTTRRGMLRLVGAAAIGGLAAAATAEPVAAGVDGDVVLNLSTNGGFTPTGISMAAAAQAYGLGCYETGLGALNADLGRPAVFGHATGAAFNKGVAGHNTATGGSGVYGLDGGPDPFGVGVKGKSTNGTGVWAEGASIGLYATGNEAVNGFALNGVGLVGSGSRGAIRMRTFGVGAPPARATNFDKETLETDSEGNVWYCYEGGTPGKWRKLAGPATGGAFHPITPTRVYDSRAAAPSPGTLAVGANRTVSVADGRDAAGAVITADLVPAGATAVAANVTVTSTTGSFGYLAINPGGNTTEGASTINWSSAGQTIANGVTLTLNTTRQLTVICNGIPGASTHFLIDIAGYYL